MFFKEFIFMSMQSINNFCEDLGQSVFNCEICKGSEKERIQILLLRQNYEISLLFLNKCKVLKVSLCAFEAVDNK